MTARSCDHRSYSFTPRSPLLSIPSERTSPSALVGADSTCHDRQRAAPTHLQHPDLNSPQNTHLIPTTSNPHARPPTSQHPPTHLSKMSGIPQAFWNQPVRYLRWAAHEKPAIFWSIVVGSMGPPLLYVLPSIRRRFGDEDPPAVPHTYPGEL